MALTDRMKNLGLLVGCVFALAFAWTAPTAVVAAKKKPRPATTAGSTVDLPVSGSLKDDAGRVFTVSGSLHFEISEPPPPPPPPVSVTLTGITDTFGAPVTSRPSGWICIVKGTNLPTTGALRLQVAGRIAPVSAWTPTAITFTVPPGPLTNNATATGPVEVYTQVAGTWKLVVRGLSFTINPSVPGAP